MEGNEPAPYTVDLNSDLGESFGAYRLGDDERLMEFISSANIACGFHAGDPHIMRQTVRLALSKGVAVGAHPGYPDLAGFGRRPLPDTPEEVYEMVLYQVGALSAFVKAEGERLRHVKPHGALYNLAAQSESHARAIAEAVYALDPSLILFGLAGSALLHAGESIGLQTASEVFADRTYLQDGTLTPRSHPRAVLHDTEAAIRQVLRMILQGNAISIEGGEVPVKADTLCIHGDTPHAADFAQQIRNALTLHGIRISPVPTMAS